jgi:hypothetical protein
MLEMGLGEPAETNFGAPCHESTNDPQ